MRDAYNSGILSCLAKQADAVLPEATKTSHIEIRNLFKTCVLGVQ
jgi:hypothetical protein